MDLLTLCQGLGVALAAGLVIGALVPPIIATWGVAAGAAPLGIALSALWFSSEGEAVWPAFVIGPLGAALAGVVSRDVAAGAARRERGDDSLGASAPPGVTGLILVAAVVVGALGLLVPPVSIVVAGGLAGLWLARKRRAGRKHEGLRVLR